MIMPYKGKTPRIGHNVYIAPTAVLIGDVDIGDNASVWFGAVLRGDLARISVGENSNIQDNCTVHTDEDKPVNIGRNVTVGHNAVVHGCTVEEYSLIGINAVVLNDARIRKGSIVAAGSVVLEGKQVGPWELVAGAPAKTRKNLSPIAAGDIPLPVQNYLMLSRAYQEK